MRVCSDLNSGIARAMEMANSGAPLVSDSAVDSFLDIWNPPWRISVATARRGTSMWDAPAASGKPFAPGLVGAVPGARAAAPMHGAAPIRTGMRPGRPCLLYFPTDGCAPWRAQTSHARPRLLDDASIVACKVQKRVLLRCHLCS